MSKEQKYVPPMPTVLFRAEIQPILCALQPAWARIVGPYITTAVIPPLLLYECVIDGLGYSMHSPLHHDLNTKGESDSSTVVQLPRLIAEGHGPE